MEEIRAHDLILVAIVKTPRDLEIARVLGWYRIPLATAPKTMRVDWLAFYQTASFGNRRWQVEWFARVRGYELLRRADLLREESEHPRANDPYFKVQLGPLQRLDQPVPSARWRRFTFLYTTGERLLRARDMRDLRAPASNERDILWKLLRDRRSTEGD